MNQRIVLGLKKLTDGLRPRARIYVTLKGGSRRRVQGLTENTATLLLGGEKQRVPLSDVIGIEVAIGEVSTQ